MDFLDLGALGFIIHIDVEEHIVGDRVLSVCIRVRKYDESTNRYWAYGRTVLIEEIETADMDLENIICQDIVKQHAEWTMSLRRRKRK